MKKCVALLLLECLLLTFLCGCDSTTYPEQAIYICEEPFFEYNNTESQSPLGNSRLEHNGEIIYANLGYRGYSGTISLVEEVPPEENPDVKIDYTEYASTETIYLIDWKLDKKGNIILKRYTPDDEYIDTITLVKQTDEV